MLFITAGIWRLQLHINELQFIVTFTLGSCLHPSPCCHQLSFQNSATASILQNDINDSVINSRCQPHVNCFATFGSKSDDSEVIIWETQSEGCLSCYDELGSEDPGCKLWVLVIPDWLPTLRGLTLNWGAWSAGSRYRRHRIYLSRE